MPLIETCEDLSQLLGLEGEAAQRYFDGFGELILQQREAFAFTVRSRRPPLDNINALLSFAYTLLAHDCTAALEGVGLDPYVGFLHRLRPGRRSLALDLMEELRPVFADRFVLSCVNQKGLTAKHLHKQENGAVLLTDEGRPGVFVRLADEEAGADYSSVPGRKAALGSGSSRTGASSGPHAAWGSRFVPTVFLEIKASKRNMQDRRWEAGGT